MNRNQIAGNWYQLKGSIQQQWARFTDDGFTDDVAVNLQGDAYSNGNTEHANKFGYDDTVGNKSASRLPDISMQNGSGGNGKDSEGPGDGEGIPGSGEDDDMDDSGKPIPNPMPDDLDEPVYAKDKETPHQEKSLNQT